MTDMACEHAKLLLSHQLDGGLNALDTAALDQHLTQCGACRASAEALWRQDRLLVELQAAPVVEELASRIRRKLSRPQPSLHSRRWASASLALAAAVVLLAVGIPLVRRQAGPQRPLPAPGAIELSQVRFGDVLVDGVESQTVGDGSSIQVVGDRPAVVRLTDGSEAEFEPGTTALIHGRQDGGRPWIELNEGSGTFRVEKADGEFQVTTHVGRVTALGTEFSVGLWPSSPLGDMTMKMRSALLAVAVLSGMVKVEFDGQEFVLGGGESRVFGADRGAAPAEGRARVPAEGGRAAGGERGEQSFAVRGTVESADKAKLTLKSRNGSTDYELASDVVVTIDGKPAKVEDISVGMQVILDRKAETGPVSVVNVQAPIVSGEVKSVGSDGKMITIATPASREAANPEQMFALADDVVVRLSGREPVKVADVQPGMQVALRLTVDKKTVLSITRIQPRGEGDTGARRGEGDKPGARPAATPGAPRSR